MNLLFRVFGNAPRSVKLTMIASVALVLIFFVVLLFVRPARQPLIRDRGRPSDDYLTTLKKDAEFCTEQRDYKRAKQFREEEVDITKEWFGEKHPEYAGALNDLAELDDTMHQYDAAERLFREALSIRKEVLGEKHPDYVLTLNDLGDLYLEMGDYARARPLLEQTLEADKALLGEKHPRYANALNDLAGLYADMGEYDKAEPKSRQALEILRNLLDASANVQSERQQLRMADALQAGPDLYLSITERAKTSPEQVYANVLAWKGAVSARQQAMRRLRASLESTDSTASVGLFDEFASASRQLSNESFSPPTAPGDEAGRQRLAELSDRVQSLQKQLASTSRVFANHLQQQHGFA